MTLIMQRMQNYLQSNVLKRLPNTQSKKLIFAFCICIFETLVDRRKCKGKKKTEVLLSTTGWWTKSLKKSRFSSSSLVPPRWHLVLGGGQASVNRVQTSVSDLHCRDVVAGITDRDLTATWNPRPDPNTGGHSCGWHDCFLFSASLQLH